MKLLFSALFIAATFLLTACDSPATPAAKTDQGTAIGNSGVKVSGAVEAGGTVNARK